METKDKCGISIKNPRLLRLDSLTSQSTSKAQENQEPCKSTAPTQDGGNFSNMKEAKLEDLSQMLLTTEYLM